MNTSQLIATLIPLLLQYSPQLISDVANLIHGNPQQQAETDDAYIARLVAIIDQNTATIAAEDKQIQS